MLCAKCHKKRASVHFTPVSDGVLGDTISLCADCASACGLPAQEPDHWTALWKEELGRLADQALRDKQGPASETE